MASQQFGLLCPIEGVDDICVYMRVGVYTCHYARCVPCCPGIPRAILLRKMTPNRVSA